MVKHKITVTVDEELVDRVRRLDGGSSLSSVVNDALAAHVDRIGRLAALRELLDEWDGRLGPVDARSAAAAAAAFDELDGCSGGVPTRLPEPV